MRGNQFNFFDSNKSVVIADSNKLRTYDGSNLLNVKPITQRVDFVGGVDAQNVTWSEQNSIVTITHSMNCIPIVCIYTQYNEQIQPDLQILSANTFSIGFQYPQTGNVYYCVINYGTEYGSPTAISSTLTAYVSQANEAKNSAQAAKTLAQNAAGIAISNSIQLEFKINENEELIMTKLSGQSFDFDVDENGNLIFSVSL